MGREEGLDIRPDVARRIADSSGGNRALIAQELGKFALFVDAAPDRPREIDHDVVDAVGAASEGGDLSRPVDSVGGGDGAMLRAAQPRLKSEGIEGRSVTRETG